MMRNSSRRRNIRWFSTSNTKNNTAVRHNTHAEFLATISITIVIG